MKPKVMVLFTSMLGNTFLMAKGVCRGIEEEGGEAILHTVPELLHQSIIDSNERIKKAKEMQKGTLVNKPPGVFCCTGSLHGGQETTLISMMFTLIHHGAIIVGIPYSVKESIETKKGGTPYGPTVVVGHLADQPPTETDLKIAKELGKRVTGIAQKLE